MTVHEQIGTRTWPRISPVAYLRPLADDHAMFQARAKARRSAAAAKPNAVQS
jgi:hypothetical protein